MNELNHPSAIPVPVDVSPMATLPIDHHPVAAYLTSPSEVCRTTVLCALHKYLFSNWEVYWKDTAARCLPEKPLQEKQVKFRDHPAGRRFVILGIEGQEIAPVILRERVKAAAKTAYSIAVPDYGSTIQVQSTVTYNQ